MDLESSLFDRRLLAQSSSPNREGLRRISDTANGKQPKGNVGHISSMLKSKLAMTYSDESAVLISQCQAELVRSIGEWTAAGKCLFVPSSMLAGQVIDLGRNNCQYSILRKSGTMIED